MNGPRGVSLCARPDGPYAGLAPARLTFQAGALPFACEQFRPDQRERSGRQPHLLAGCGAESRAPGGSCMAGLMRLGCRRKGNTGDRTPAGFTAGGPLSMPDRFGIARRVNRMDWYDLDSWDSCTCFPGQSDGPSRSHHRVAACHMAGRASRAGRRSVPGVCSDVRARRSALEASWGALGLARNPFRAANRPDHGWPADVLSRAQPQAAFVSE
jgi:hypothetical protein